MRLVVDTSVLVGELLRAAGRQRLREVRLELFIPEEMWDEFQVEMPRRVTALARDRGLTDGQADGLLRAASESVDTNAILVTRAVYGAFEEEAAWRSGRDLNDWPLVACSLALDAGVWTNDRGLFGTGVPTWVTPTVQAWLDHTPEG